jgi:4-hydroxybenzoate polyprenyltransferase
LQHHVSKQLKEYLLLIRLPNVFTTPSNILAGYFAAVTVAEANSGDLVPLMISSGLLYVAGIVLNDYFDIEIDKKERPSRPLASGTISKRHALAIAIVALLIANTMALIVDLTSLAVSLALTVAIIAYDYRLKYSISGPFAMGITRFLNIILGASPVLLYVGAISYTIIGATAASLFLYVVAVTILSKKEAGNEKPNSTIAFLMVFGVIAAIIALGLLVVQLHWAFLLNLSIFATVMTITFKQHLMTDLPSVQKAVRNMVISIIILDSVFISGTAGPLYGLATLLLIAPSVALAKKLYVT